ncbi:hypothetical protein QM480_07865 [Flectobacillus sp. DC10W]|uniref:Uncharacterized protein n=1 Tax=Flectobacillus longus TaxID=2984207 RepID=A0ABT6YM06_9BACT|nr:hypothetical protein [Flectobacillus longus]MDI9864236.1 hypothetical protein [Flectobacillus longus]
MSSILTLSFPEVEKRLSQAQKALLFCFSKHQRTNYIDSYFLWYEGDTNLDKIDLESDNYDFELAGIIVDGNLSCEKILNYETDYGVNLIVLGHLNADFIAVGGQQVFVQEDLTVQHLFVGSYNHGNLDVLGDFNCPIVVLDDYDCLVRGEFYGNVLGWGKTIELLHDGETQYVPDGDYDFEDFFDEPYLNAWGSINFSLIVSDIDHDIDVLRKYVLNPETDSITPEIIIESSKSSVFQGMSTDEYVGVYSTQYKSHITDNSMELSILEYDDSFKYSLIGNLVSVFHKNSEDTEFVKLTLGSNIYRKAKRVLLAI